MYEKINLQIEELVNTKNNKHLVIPELYSKVQNLELEILNLEKIVEDENKELYNITAKKFPKKTHKK